MRTITLRSDGNHWIAACRAANLLARQGMAPLWATAPFTGVTSAGHRSTFRAGTIVITTEAHNRRLDALIAGSGAEAIAVTDADEIVGHPLRPLRIAVYGGGGAPYNHAAAYGELGFHVDFVFPVDVRAGVLSGYDMFVVPGGGNRAMMGQIDPLGEEGCKAIASFVNAGGMYLGCCAGAYDVSLVAPEFLQICPTQEHLQMVNAAVWNSGTEWLGIQSPGVGVLRSRLAVEHPVTFGMPDEFPITHYNGPFYRLQPGTIGLASDAVGLLTVAGYDPGFTPSERFLDGVIADSELLVSRAVDFGAYNAVAGSYGKGRVVIFGSHPEMGLSLDLDRWDAPVRMLANAALWQAIEGSGTRSEGRASDAPRSGASALASLVSARPKIARVVDLAEDLLARDTSTAGWLDNSLAMSTFGLSGAEIWTRNLAGFRSGADAMLVSIAALEAKVATASRHVGDPHGAAAVAVAELDKAINHVTPIEWDIDVGYEGLLQQLDRATDMLEKAIANFDRDFAPDANPYAYLGESPFQLAVGSYLSAAGVFANCALLLRLQEKRLENSLMLAATEPELMD